MYGLIILLLDAKSIIIYTCIFKLLCYSLSHVIQQIVENNDKI